MPTELDRRMDAAIAALTAESGPLAVQTVEHGGLSMPMIAPAPPTLAAYFAHFCAQHRDAVFLVAGDERLTFGAVHAEAERIAKVLVASHGVAKGDRVGIAMRNSPSWVVLFMGIVMAGGVATLLNGWWETDELQAAIDDTGCDLIFADLPRAKRLAAISGIAARVVAIDDTLPLGEAMAPVGTGDAALPALTGDDLAMILFTSGSTGQSKGALSDHRAVVQGIFSFLAQALVMLTLTTQDGKPPVGQPGTLLALPLFHITGLLPVMLQSFAMGRKVVVMPKWDAEEAMRLIDREKLTYFVGVPLMSFEMLTHPNRAAHDLNSLTDIAAGGAPRPVEHVKRIDAEMGGPAPLIGYGLTETNGVGSGNWRANYLAKPQSIGRPSPPLVDVAILDDAGRAVAPGERGEVGIRSICNFREYWRAPEATAAAFNADGYFLTGDIGYLDDDGYLFIVDRKKDIIIRGGENISCQEVEAALYADADVAECAVFSLPDERFGEVPAAVVFPADGAALTPAALVEALEHRIAAFKVPQRIWIAEEALPRLGTEKIDKVALRQTYRALAAVETVEP